MQQSHGSYGKFNFFVAPCEANGSIAHRLGGEEWGAQGGFNGVFLIISPDSGSYRGSYFQYRQEKWVRWH